MSMNNSKQEVKTALLTPQPHEFKLKVDLETAIIKTDVNAIRQLVDQHNLIEISEVIQTLAPNKIIFVLRMLRTDDCAKIFAHLPPEIQEQVIHSFHLNEIQDMLKNLYTSDISEVLDELPSNLVTKILKAADNEVREDIYTLLNYDVNSAARYMSMQIIYFYANMKVSSVLNQIKSEPHVTRDMVYYYVLDNKKKVLGYVTLKDLIFNSSQKKLSQIMQIDPVCVLAQAKNDELLNSFRKYDVPSIAIINHENCLIGVVNYDEIVDLLENITSEDVQKSAAISPTRRDYLRTGIVIHSFARIRWLIFLMISASLSQIALAGFQSIIANDFTIVFTPLIMASLISLLPVISGTAGNAGTQASTVVIRALSLNEIGLRDYLNIIWKEIRIALFVGLMLAGANVIRMLIIDLIYNHAGMVIHLWQWKEVISTFFALITAVLLAKTVGASLPLLAKKVNIDPAVMAAPLLTTLTDALATTIFFSIGIFVFMLFHWF